MYVCKYFVNVSYFPAQIHTSEVSNTQKGAIPAPNATEFDEITRPLRLLRCSRSSKVTEFVSVSQKSSPPPKS